jgi:hypothetical protein
MLRWQHLLAMPFERDSFFDPMIMTALLPKRQQRAPATILVDLDEAPIRLRLTSLLFSSPLEH